MSPAFNHYGPIPAREHGCLFYFVAFAVEPTTPKRLSGYLLQTSVWRQMSVAIIKDDGIRSWGRAHRFEHRVARPHFDDEIASAVLTVGAEGTVLARGLGRSYGDSALNAGGGLVAMDGLDRFVAFDDTTGVLRRPPASRSSL